LRIVAGNSLDRHGVDGHTLSFGLQLGGDDAGSGEKHDAPSAHQQITHRPKEAKRGFDFRMSSEADKIAQFRSITGAPESIARSFLESTNWDLQVFAGVSFH